MSRIVGIGTDIVAVDRIKRACRRLGFVQRILTGSEIAVADNPERVAARWAAKEAVAKAWPAPLTWHDVEIVLDDRGAPRVCCADIDGSGEFRTHVSLSHERGYAIAVVVIEKTQ